MSYESYRGQNQAQPTYGQYNPYGQEEAPANYGQETYGQVTNARPGDGDYNRDPEQGNGRYEMTNLNGANTNSNDPNRILNECRVVDRAIDEIEAKLQRLNGLRTNFLDARDVTTETTLRRDIDSVSGETMQEYRSLVDRVKRIKQNPESGNQRNSAQVGKVDRRLKRAINQFQQLDREYRNKSQDQFRRQYMIVRPDASEAEVREAMESPDQQIFSQALINSDRRGQAQSTRQNVQARHEQIQKIERQMMELAQLFQDLETLVVQQEPAVAQIEQKGEEVNQNVSKGNTELTGAVKKARAARRKKWICLGIVVLIIIVIIVVILAVLAAQKKL